MVFAFIGSTIINSVFPTVLLATGGSLNVEVCVLGEKRWSDHLLFSFQCFPSWIAFHVTFNRLFKNSLVPLLHLALNTELH